MRARRAPARLRLPLAVALERMPPSRRIKKQTVRFTARFTAVPAASSLSRRSGFFMASPEIEGDRGVM